MVQALLRRNRLRAFLLSPRITKLVLGDTLEELCCVHSIAIWIITWHWNWKRNVILDRDLGSQIFIDTVWVFLACLDHVSMGLAL